MSSAYFELYRDRAGFWRWRLRTSNGKSIADSAQGFRLEDDCRRSANLARRCCDSAALVARGQQTAAEGL